MWLEDARMSDATTKPRKKPDIEPGMKLSDKQVFALIKSLNERFNGKGVIDGQIDTTTFGGRVDYRRSHLHALEIADPKLSEPWNDGTAYQSDLPRRIAVEMVSRLTENPVTIDVGSPKETSKTGTAADDFATVLGEMWRDVQQRLGLNIQEAVSLGQAAEVFGLVHWRMDPDLIPSVEEPEELDELPDCPMCEGTKKAAGAKCPECKGRGYDLEEAKKYKQVDGKWVERDEGVMERTKQKRAAAGAPLYVELPDVAGFAWTTDRSPRPGFATCRLVRKVGILDYREANGEAPELPDDDAKRPTSIEAMNPDLQIGEEPAAPRQWMPSWINWQGDTNDDIWVYEFWTRDEYYEVVDFTGWSGANDDNAMVVRKRFKHWYKMPPFIIVPAVVNNVADPILKYEPYLEGVYRTKPYVDRLTSLLAVMAEKLALSYYYWKNTSTGQPLLGADGNIEIVFERDSAKANIAPPGYELTKAEDVTIHPAFVESVRDRIKEMTDAAPPTGQAEVTATTQPFAIKMQQEQASIVLRSALRNQVNAFQTMIENWAHCLTLPAEKGGYGETLYVNPSTVDNEGKRITDRSKTVGVDPKIIPSLTINVNISGTSQAEQTTKTQIGIQLLGDENVPLTRKYILQNYMGIERAQDMLDEHRAERVFNTEIEPGLTKQLLAKRFGGVFVVAPDGQAVGFSGQKADPYAVLAQNGIMPVVPRQQAAPGMSATPGAPPPLPPATMGATAPMQVPGSLPVPGIV